VPHQAPNIADQYLLSFRAGDEDGFTYFFNTYYKALCFFANKYVKNIAVAEEIAEDGFMAIWDKRQQFTTHSGLRSYLYKCVYNKCLRWLENKLREEKHIRDYAVITGDPEKDFTESVFKTETLRLLKVAMDELPAQCKKIFFKLYVEGKTVAQTATELSLTISTINNQKARGIKLLKPKLSSLSLLIVACELFYF
jgi:RNA polymerase sigma-70 factor (family 1)